MITVITAALPTRATMLSECIASIAAQALAPTIHLIGVDSGRRGSSAVRNDLLAAVRTPWVAVLDDDDVALPEHLLLLRAAADAADIAYSLPRVEGRDGWQPVGPFDAERLRRESYIPATALIRTDLLLRLGGWRDAAASPRGWEDWDLWLRALDAGARFAYVPEVTWRYRFHGGNKTHKGEKGAA